MTTTYKVGADGIPVIDKSPSALLDYIIDLLAEDPGPWLQDGETIVSASFVAQAGLTVLNVTPAPPGAATRLVCWLSGGTVGTTYLVTVHFVTTESREDSRSFRVRVVLR